jgi:hypothetical protein
MTTPSTGLLVQVIAGRKPGEHEGDRVHFYIVKDSHGGRIEFTGTVLHTPDKTGFDIVEILSDRRSNRYRSRVWYVPTENVTSFCEDMEFPEEG